MAKTFGFLRAVNVGGRRMAMLDLASALQAIGLAQVETFIASGNFVFDGQLGESDIEAALLAAFGFTSEVFVRRADEIKAMLDLIAAASDRDVWDAVHVGFLKEAPNQAVRDALSAIANEADHFTLGPREVIWWAKGRVSDTPFGKKGMKGKGLPVITFRNIMTLGRMLGKWG